MKRLLFLVEGPTDEEFLRAFLCHIGLASARFEIHPFGGRPALLADFVSSLGDPRDGAVVILADQDNLEEQDEYDDCNALKSAFEKQIPKNLRQHVRVRLACHEREAWYLGDISALKEAYPDTPSTSWKKIGVPENPDTVPNPSEQLAGIRHFKHTDAARKMGKALGRKCKGGGDGGNRSASFRCFVKGVQDLLRLMKRK